jgi:hypothetical protein
MTDREIYGAILAGDHAQFVALADELAAALVHDKVELVAGDAVEGFNPSHDVCRYVVKCRRAACFCRQQSRHRLLRLPARGNAGCLP